MRLLQLIYLLVTIILLEIPLFIFSCIVWVVKPIKKYLEKLLKKLQSDE